MTDREERQREVEVAELGQAIEAITLDFGNTLVAFPSASMGGVLSETAERAAARWGFAAEQFERTWSEERSRQLSEDVPEGREANMDVRAARVLARLRGHAVPPEGERWDDAEVAGWSSPDEVEAVLEDYTSAFVRLTPVPPEIGPLLETLAARYPLAIVSNWPIAIAVERFLEAAGWSAHLSAVVISQRVGGHQAAARDLPGGGRGTARCLWSAASPCRRRSGGGRCGGARRRLASGLGASQAGGLTFAGRRVLRRGPPGSRRRSRDRPAVGPRAPTAARPLARIRRPPLRRGMRGVAGGS